MVVVVVVVVVMVVVVFYIVELGFMVLSPCVSIYCNSLLYVVKISKEEPSCWNSRCTIPVIFQRPMMIGTYFILSDRSILYIFRYFASA